LNTTERERHTGDARGKIFIGHRINSSRDDTLHERKSKMNKVKNISKIQFFSIISSGLLGSFSVI
jgi:hypothetical protein